jgi:hypothetical protein
MGRAGVVAGRRARTSVCRWTLGWGRPSGTPLSAEYAVWYWLTAPTQSWRNSDITAS